MPCLWFADRADEAVDFYVSVFPNSRRVADTKYGPGAPLAEGSTLTVNFELAGAPFMALNGGPMFQFTPAVSFVVSCATQEDLDRYWGLLLEGGSASQCGWLTDRFGVSWQVVPDRLAELVRELDPARRGRVMAAMLQMVKLDIAELEAAADG
jgi:predicted 3-demethylubiquinone-9 3-methyltransferase (glyoxalase superfamily)